MIRISAPRGVAPASDPLALGDQQAQECLNVRLSDGVWKPFKAPVKVADYRRAGSIQTIFLYGDNEVTDWWEWATAVNVAPINRYSNNSVVFTGDGNPKITNGVLAAGAGARPNVAYDLGLAFPTAAPTVSVTGAPTVGEQSFEVFVVYTFVDAEGKESRPSPPSLVVTATASQAINLAGMQTPSGNNSYTGKRVYATQGASTTGFFLRGDVPAGQATFAFVAAKPDQGQGPGDALETQNMFAPPTDSRSVVYMPNEFLAMISGNEIVFSEAGLVYGFPPDYRIKCPETPVALAVFGNTVVVGTKGRQYLYQGIEPGQMQEIKGDRAFACASARSMVDADGAAVGYASPEGWVVVTQNGSTLITGPHFSKTAWTELNPASMHAVFWDRYFVVFYDAGGANKRAIVIPVDGSEPFFWDVWASAAYTKLSTNQLYLALNDGIYRYDAGSNLSWSWRSKEFPLERKKAFAALQVRCTGSVTVTAFADGRQQWQRTVSNDVPIPVGMGYRSAQWSFRLQSSAIVQSFAIAENMQQLLQT